MNNFKYILFFLLIIFFIKRVDGQASLPTIQNGVIDISSWNFAEQGTIDLDGKWEFYWQEKYMPEDFISPKQPDAYLKVPGVWTNLKIPNKQVRDTGFATYRLLIKSDKDIDLHILLKEIMTSYEVYFNGKKVRQLGVVGTNSNEHLPAVWIEAFPLNLKKGTNELIIQVGNYEHRLNSFFESPSIGTEYDIDIKLLRFMTLDIIVIGLLLLLSLYFFSSSFIENKRANLVFSILALLAAFRVSVSGTYLLPLIFDIPWSVVYFVMYFTHFSILAVSILYIQIFFKEKKHKIFFYSTYAISFIYCLTLLLPSLVYSKLIIYFQILFVVIISYTIYMLVNYVKQNKSGALILLISFSMLALSAIHDSIYFSGIIDSVSLSTLGFLLFIMGIVTSLGKFNIDVQVRSDNLKDDLSKQNIELEQKIEEKKLKLQEQAEELKIQNENLETLNSNLNKYFIIIDRLPLGILISDTNEIIVYVNNYYKKILNFPEEEILNQSVESFFGKGVTFKSTRTGLLETLSNKEVWHGEFIDYDKNGKEIIQVAIVVPILNRAGELSYYTSIVDDITQLRAKENLFRDKNKRLENLYEELQSSHLKIKNNIEFIWNLQNTLLPVHDVFATIFQACFVIYRPKARIGGDFYFSLELDNYLYFAVGDCTGHGIPGAFLTILSISMLKEILLNNKNNDTGFLLNLYREKIKSVFTTTGNKIQDGLDISLCCLDKNNFNVTFSGANLPILVKKDNEIVEYKATRNPIGFYPIEKDFNSTEIQLKKEDIIYLFSDGITDQFNSKRSKFSKKRLIKMLKDINKLPMEEQKKILDTTLIDWQGETMQIDDITMLGLKL